EAWQPRRRHSPRWTTAPQGTIETLSRMQVRRPRGATRREIWAWSSSVRVWCHVECRDVDRCPASPQPHTKLVERPARGSAAQLDCGLRACADVHLRPRGDVACC